MLNLRSLRVKAIFGTTLLSLFGAALAFNGLSNAWWQRDEAIELEAASRVLTTLSRGAIEASLERSVSQLTVELDEPITPELRAIVTQQRSKADSAFADAANQARTLKTSNRINDFLNELKRLNEEIQSIRKQFDSLFDKPYNARSIENIRDLPFAFKSRIVQVQGLRLLLRNTDHELPTYVSMLETIQDQAWQVREFGGRERTYFAIAAAKGKPISEQRLSEMAVLNRRVEDSWADIRRIVSHEGMPKTVISASKDVEDGYFGKYNAQRKTMLVEASRPLPKYENDLKAFFASSGTALDQVTNVSIVAGNAIATFWLERANKVILSLILNASVAVAFIIGAVLLTILLVNAFKRLDAIRYRMEALASGDQSTPVPYGDNKDEVGDMARTVAIFRDSAIQKELLERAAANSGAIESRSNAVNNLIVKFDEKVNAVLQSVMGSVSILGQTAVDIDQATKKTLEQSTSAVASAQQTSKNVNSVAKASTSLHSAILFAAQRINAASNAANKASKTARSTSELVAELREAASSIGGVVEVISKIAGQTNLLALNATIESARAGEAGKGFAVVASEVKHLAGQTELATKNIAQQITIMRNVTDKSVEAIAEILATISEVDCLALEVSATVEQQTASTAEISSQTVEAADGTNELRKSAESVKNAALESEVAAERVRRAAMQLSIESENLRSDISQFLEEIRAA